MKNIKENAIAPLALAAAMGLAAADATATLWTPTDGNINVFWAELDTGEILPTTFAIFDSADTDFLDPLSIDPDGDGYQTIDVWYTDAGLALDNGVDTLFLTGDTFRFAFQSSSGWSTQIGYWSEKPGVAFWYVWSDDGVTDDSFSVMDANPVTAPVPVPPAVWLFGSGLIGLAGIGRRRG